MTLAIHIADDEAGRPCCWPVGGGHLLVVGSTGAGKSSLPRAVINHASVSPHVQFVGVDLKAVELGQYKARLSTLATERNHAARALDEVVAIMEARKTIAARHGWTKWPATGRHPYLVVLVDELAELTRADGLGPAAKLLAERCAGNLDRVGRLGRALGIGLVAATQRAEAAVLGANLRALFGWRLALASLDEASYRLGLGVSGDVDLSHLTSGLTTDRPGVGILLDPAHPSLRVVRVAWYTDEHVAFSMKAGSKFRVELGHLLEWARADAAALVVAS